MMTRIVTSLCLVTLVLAGGAVGGYLWWQSRPTPLPEIPLEGLEPEVASAIKMGCKGVEKEPHSGAAWGLLGRILHANDMPSELKVTCFKEAERLDPQNPRWPYFRGGILLNLNRFEEAIAALQRAVDLCEHSDEAPLAPRLLLAETLLVQGQVAAAEDHFRRVLQKAPKEARALFGIAQVAYGRGEWQTCRANLELCMSMPQARKKSAAMLATVCEQLGDKRNADKYSDLAARLPKDIGWMDPYSIENLHLSKRKSAQYRIVEHLTAEGKVSQATEMMSQLLQVYPDDYRAHVAMARILPRMRQFDQAEKHIRRAQELAPDKLQVDYLLALILYSRGEVLAKGNSHDRKEARALFELAVKSARKVLTLKSDYGFAHMVLGWSLRQLGQREQALAAFRAAVHCNPEFAENHYFLGLVLSEDERTIDEALAHLEEARLLGGSSDRRAELILNLLRSRARERIAAPTPDPDE